MQTRKTLPCKKNSVLAHSTQTPKRRPLSVSWDEGEDDRQTRETDILMRTNKSVCG